VRLCVKEATEMLKRSILFACAILLATPTLFSDEGDRLFSPIGPRTMLFNVLVESPLRDPVSGQLSARYPIVPDDPWNNLYYLDYKIREGIVSIIIPTEVAMQLIRRRLDLSRFSRPVLQIWGAEFVVPEVRPVRSPLTHCAVVLQPVLR